MLLPSLEACILLAFSLNWKFGPRPTNNVRNFSLYTRYRLELNQNVYSLMESALGDMNHHIYVSIILLFSFEKPVYYFLP